MADPTTPYIVPLPEWRVRGLLSVVCRRMGYHNAQIDGNNRFVSAIREETPTGRIQARVKETLEVRWMPQTADSTRIEACVYDDAQWPHRLINHNAAHRFWRLWDEEAARLPPVLADVSIALDGAGELLLGPGERLDESAFGYAAGPLPIIRDYAGCAPLSALGALRNGPFPLGAYALFGKGKPKPSRGAELFLSEVGGSIVCGGPGSGKTSLLARWIVAAWRHHYSVLLIDSKGDLMARAQSAVSWGKRHFFSTSRADDLTDRLNLLPAGHDSRRVELFSRLLLPQESREVQQRAAALTHILGIYSEAFPEEFDLQPADVSTLQTLARDEKRLSAWVGRLQGAASDDAKAWLHGLLDGLSGDLFPDEGRRHPKQSYADHMGMIERAARVAAFGEKRGRSFSLRQVLTSEEPVLAALEIVPEESDRLELTPALVREELRNALSERSRLVRRRQSLPPVLLIVDDAWRQPECGATALPALAREMNIHCTVSLDHLDQLGGEPRQIDDILGRSNLICLGSVAGSTYEAILHRLGTRSRQHLLNHFENRSSDGQNRNVSLEWKTDAYFTKHEMKHLPAGGWPALVLASGAGINQPFLTDLHEPNPISGTALPALADGVSTTRKQARTNLPP